MSETQTQIDNVTKSTEDMILDYLLRGHSLTTLEAWRLFHTSELRHYIAKLRKRGYGILGEWVKVHTYGKDSKIKIYRVNK